MHDTLQVFYRYMVSRNVDTKKLPFTTQTKRIQFSYIDTV